jgi:hypothetical protein
MASFLDTLIGVGCPPELAQILSDQYAGGSLVRTDGQVAWDVDAGGDLNQDATYGGSVILTADDTSVAQPAGTGLTAAGTTITDALQLAKVYNNLTTVAAGTGAKLFDGEVGTAIGVSNNGLTPLSLYPPAVGSTISTLSAGAALQIDPYDSCVFVKVSATLWNAYYSAFNSVNAAVTAAGTTIADATQLVAKYNNVTTAAANTGVKLLLGRVGGTQTVRNAGANDLKVYPPTASEGINAEALGAAITLAAATDQAIVLTRVSATKFIGTITATA